MSAHSKEYRLEVFDDCPDPFYVVVDADTGIPFHSSTGEFLQNRSANFLRYGMRFYGGYPKDTYVERRDDTPSFDSPNIVSEHPRDDVHG